MAKDKPYQFRVEIPEEYKGEVREAIGAEILAHIRERTLKGIDVDGKKFPKYSKAYENSVNFRAAGKSKGKVDLTLSGDMLAYLEVVKESEGELVVGYSDDSSQAGKAEGNQIGSYGKDKGDPSKARRFIGISKDAVQKILSKYPVDNEAKTESRAEAVIEAQSKIDKFIDTAESFSELTPKQLLRRFKLKIGDR